MLSHSFVNLTEWHKRQQLIGDIKQTLKKYLNFTPVQLWLFSGLEILVKSTI